jgi:putative transposase
VTIESDSFVPYRRSLRLKEYDYSQAGAYFVTICTRNRECIFGHIYDSGMQLNDAGRMVQSVWDKLPTRFPGLGLDAFVVMPNHVHGVIVLVGAGLALSDNEGAGRGESCIRPGGSGNHKDRPYGTAVGSVGRIMQAFKSMVTHEYVMGVRQHGWPPFQGQLWQRNYYEHVIRKEDDLNDVRQYIFDNPAHWAEDENNLDRIKSAGRLF